MQQDDDLFSGAYARHGDPQTSRDAAVVVNVSKLQRIVIDCLRRNGARTCTEVAELTGIPLWSLSPRFKPLEDMGIVERTGTKACLNSSGRIRNLTLWRLKSPA